MLDSLVSDLCRVTVTATVTFMRFIIPDGLVCLSSTEQAARKVARECPGVQVRVFSDRDILSKQAEVDEALKGADVFFGSLLFDYDQVEWLRERVQQIPIRLVFESALELMGTTQLGGFKVLHLHRPCARSTPYMDSLSTPCFVCNSWVAARERNIGLRGGRGPPQPYYAIEEGHSGANIGVCLAGAHA